MAQANTSGPRDVPRPRRWLLAPAIALGLLLASTGIRPEAASAHHEAAPIEAGPAYSLEDKFVDLLNDARRSAGLRDLRRVPRVDNVARDWAQQMAVSNKLAHRPDLRSPFAGDWRRLAENVGVGYSVTSLHRGFMESPGHRQNVLGDFDHVGVGVALAGPRLWVTLNFVRGDPTSRGSYATDPLFGRYPTGAGGDGDFHDISNSVHVNSIERLDAADIAISCATGRYCPKEPLRRAEMARLLARALELPPAGERFRDVPDDHLYADEIGALAAAGITYGCNPPDNDRFCPEDPVTRDQMASFFARALPMAADAPTPFRDVPSSNVHSRNIAALAGSGITKGCNPPDNTEYCPREPVTRAQMASFIVRAIGQSP